MTMDLMRALNVSASGMKAQGTRLRVISENIANQDSVGTTKGVDPYRRKTIVFKEVFDKVSGATLVHVIRSVAMTRTSPWFTSRTIRWPMTTAISSARM